MSDKGSEAPANPSSSSGPWWKAIAEVSAFFAVVAGTVYVVGLFALWIPLATQITHDFSTSWYAVSLIPQVTVVGQGVRTVLGWPVLLVPIFVALPFLLSLVSSVSFIQPLIRRSDRFMLQRGLGRPAYDSYAEWFKWYGGFLRGHILGVGIFGLSLPLLLGWSWFNYAALVVMVIGSGIGADFIARSLEGFHERFPSIRSRKWFLRGLAVTYAVVVLNSFISSSDDDPSLPYATTSSSEVHKGLLVTHSDGYWYIFDDEGQLRAVPDEDAGAVRVSSEPITDS